MSMQGTIVKVVVDKGFGFINQEGHEKDLFFHATGMVDRADFDDLVAGDAVTYEIDDSKDRPRAVNVDIRQ